MPGHGAALHESRGPFAFLGPQRKLAPGGGDARVGGGDLGAQLVDLPVERRDLRAMGPEAGIVQRKLGRDVQAGARCRIQPAGPAFGDLRCRRRIGGGALLLGLEPPEGETPLHEFGAKLGEGLADLGRIEAGEESPAADRREECAGHEERGQDDRRVGLQAGVVDHEAHDAAFRIRGLGL